MNDLKKHNITTSQLRYKKGECKRITDLIVMMLSSSTLPYYAEFNTYINFYKSEQLKTCGVNISKEGMNFYWNQKFIDSLIDSELLFVLIHEDCHLLFDHNKRSVKYNKNISNIVQDMIINYIIVSEIMKHPNIKGKINIPKDKNEFLIDNNNIFLLDKNGNKIKNPSYRHNIALFPPIDYTGELIFENLYEWFKDEYANFKSIKNNKSLVNDDDINDDINNQNNSDNSDNSDNKNDENHKKSKINRIPNYGPYGRDGIECQSLESIFNSLDNDEQITLDSHIDDDVPENARKSIVNDFMQRLKNRGLCTYDIEKILDKLRKSKYNYLKDIKRVLTNFIFGTSKIKSITRPNRRNIEGIKGKKKYKNVVNCILDVSGSMDGHFEHVLSYIFQNDININLILNDTEIKCVYTIKNKKELQNIKIIGLGGTILQPAIDYINNPKNKLNIFNTVILTDGYTDKLNFSNSIRKFLILTTNSKPKIYDPKEITKIIVIDKENSMHYLI